MTTTPQLLSDDEFIDCWNKHNKPFALHETHTLRARALRSFRDVESAILAKLQASPQAQPERAWLIEFKPYGQAPSWWGFSYAGSVNAGWCQDASKAIRFSRKEDAEQMRLYVIAERGLRGNTKFEESVFTAEHMWVGPEIQAAQPEQAAPEFDVRTILLDVVPGWDGMGQEVYAKNVDDVVRKLTEMGEKLENLQGKPVAAQVVGEVCHFGDTGLSNEAQLSTPLPWGTKLYTHPAPSAAVVDTKPLIDSIARAYGYLWCVNCEPGTPRQYPPERAAYAARKVLRDLLTNEQRGLAINAAVQEVHEAARNEDAALTTQQAQTKGGAV